MTSATEPHLQSERKTTADKRMTELTEVNLIPLATDGERAITRQNRLVVLLFVTIYFIFVQAFHYSLPFVYQPKRDKHYSRLGGIMDWAFASKASGASDLLSEEDRTNIKMLHLFVMGMFAAILAVEATAAFIDADTARTRINVLTMGVATMGAKCYFDLATNTAHPTMVLSSAPWRVYYPSRIMTWVFTTSLVIFAGWVTGRKPMSYLLITWANNLGMIVTGYVCSAYYTGWLMWISFFVSMGFFFIAGYLQYNMFGTEMDDIKNTFRANRAVLRLRLVNVVAWSMFPLAWVLQFAPISNFYLEVITALADVCAKAVQLAAVQQGDILCYSDRKHASLMQMAMELVQDLKEREKRKGRFFAAMTHELRTPLNGMLGLLDSVLASYSSGLNPKLSGALKTIHDTGRRLMHLISTILDAASVTENKLRVHVEPVSIYAVIQEVASLIEPLMQPGTKLVINAPVDLPAVDADHVRLSQVLFNVIGNAAKFTEKGEVAVTASVDRGVMMRIEVQDSGMSRS